MNVYGIIICRQVLDVIGHECTDLFGFDSSNDFIKLSEKISHTFFEHAQLRRLKKQIELGFIKQINLSWVSLKFIFSVFVISCQNLVHL